MEEDESPPPLGMGGGVAGRPPGLGPAAAAAEPCLDVPCHWSLVTLNRTTGAAMFSSVNRHANVHRLVASRVCKTSQSLVSGSVVSVRAA